jgi:hypothetical protein
MNNDDNDLTLAYGLLGGRTVHEKYGLPTTEYLEADDDKEAREAIVRLLRGRRINGQLCEMLAALFDHRLHVNPDGTFHSDSHLIAERQICFKFRRSGRSRDHVRNSFIHHYIKTLVQGGTSVVDAQMDAHLKFHIGEEMIRNIWKRFEKLDKLTWVINSKG